MLSLLPFLAHSSSLMRQFIWLFSLWLCLIPVSYGLEREQPLHLYQQAQQREQAGDLPQAIQLSQQALAQSRETFPEDAATIANWLGDLYKKQLQFSDAAEAYQQAIKLREQVLGKEHGAVAMSLNSLGALYYQIGDYAHAEQLLQQALQIDEKSHGAEHSKVAIRLSNLAELRRTLGDYAQAEMLNKRALAIDEKLNGENHPRVAIRLSNLAEVYRLTGDYAQAEKLLQRALTIDEAAYKNGEGDAENLGIRHNNLGKLYQTLGNYPKANHFYQKSYDLLEKKLGKKHPNLAIVLNNLAWTAFLQQDLTQAETYYQQAMAITEKSLGQHPDLARQLNNLALLYVAQNKFKAAETAYLRAVAIFEKAYGKQNAALALTLNNLAKLYRRQNNLNQAENLLQRALPLAESAGEPEVLATVQDNFSQLLAQQQQIDAAILLGKQAVNTLQGLRKNIAQLDKELQHSFLNEKTQIYRRVANLLLDQGRIAEAQQVLLMLKEEEYFDLIRRNNAQDNRQVQTNFSTQEQPWVNKALQLAQHAGQIGTDLKQLRQKLELSATEKTRQDMLEQDLTQLQREHGEYFTQLKTAFNTDEQLVKRGEYMSSNIAALGREYQELRQKVKLSEREQARKEELRELMVKTTQNFNACLSEFSHLQIHENNLDTLRALQSTLRELGQGVVLVNYIIMPEKVRLILTTPEVQLCRESVITEQDFQAQLEQFRDVLQNPRKNPLKLAQSLYQVLITPIAADLSAAQAQTLMLALDGRLRYIPFAALHDGQQYLMERFGLSVFTEAARDKLKDRPAKLWRLAGLGLTEAMHGFNALPSVEKELNSIIQQGTEDKEGILQGVIYLNADFNRKNLSAVLDKGYPVLHIASHFVFQPTTDQNSFLLLGNGQELTLAEIKDSYDFGKVDLLTLSACQTAMGGSYAKGQEIEGFGALAQKQGAKGVLATLWPVDDQSTGQFMQQLYRIHTVNAVTKGQALRQAQQSFIAARKAMGAQAIYPKYYDHPYYWAPFILMGNWL